MLAHPLISINDYGSLLVISNQCQAIDMIAFWPNQLSPQVELVTRVGEFPTKPINSIYKTHLLCKISLFLDVFEYRF